MTSRTSGAPNNAPAAPTFDPSSINPLIVHHSPIDTMSAVSSVIGFVQNAIVAMQAQDESEYDLSEGMGNGLYMILETCRSALNYRVASEQEGGAA